MEVKSAVGKRRVILILFVLLFGLPPLVNSLSNPRLKGLHGPDIVQLIVIGLFLGVGLGILIGGHRSLGE